MPDVITVLFPNHKCLTSGKVGTSVSSPFQFEDFVLNKPVRIYFSMCIICQASCTFVVTKSVLSHKSTCRLLLQRSDKSQFAKRKTGILHFDFYYFSPIYFTVQDFKSLISKPKRDTIILKLPSIHNISTAEYSFSE